MRILLLIGLFGNFASADLRYLSESTPAHTNFDTVSTKWNNPPDDGNKNVSLGFSFPFNGLSYTDIRINTNGAVRLGNSGDFSYTNQSLPYQTLSIMPYWDDLRPRNNKPIYYGKLDAGGINERFVVWWDGVPEYGNNNTSYSFQVVLYKDGRIRFRYDSSSDVDGSSATVGVEEDSTYYDEHSFNSNVDLDESLDILYTPTSILGHIYEDPNGDSQTGDTVAKSAATVYLYDNSGTLLDTNVTDSSGSYSFYAPVNEICYVVVDSKTVIPDQSFNGSSNQGDVWAEQTYGGIGAQCADGSGGTSTRTSAGSCFGGRRGGTSDDASSLSNAEHRIKITTTPSTHSYTDRDFGFSFNVMTSIRDGDDDTANNRSIQGSLRQFIQNANALSGSNTMRFVPAPAKNESNWWRVSLLSDLDNITDASTTIDGTAYSLSDGTTVDNSNSGSVSVTVSTVGAGNDGRESTGDEHTLPDYEKKELEIDGGDNKVFDIREDDCTMRNLSIYNSSSPSIYVRSDNVSLSTLYIGARADGVQPTSADRISRGVIATSGADNLKLINSYIAYTTRTAVQLAGTGEIIDNVLHDNALAAYNPDAITLEGNSGQHHVKIWYNYIDAAGGYGIESWTSGGGWDIQYNTIENTGSVGSDELGGIRIFGEDSQIKHNIIKNIYGAGIAVVSKGSSNQKNIISKNVMYDNSGLSIDLDNSGASNPDGDGVSPNNGVLDSGKQNNDMDYPVVTQATYDGTTLHIEGFVGSASGQNVFGGAALEVYQADDDGNNNGEVISGDGNSTAHGEGKAFIFDCSADSSGNFSCDYSGAVSSAIHLTMTATLTSQGTSEFSANYPIILLPNMHITKNSCVIDDPVNNSTNPKRIPGATIRYAIEVSNTGLGSADNVLADDNISSNFDANTISNLKVDGSHACNCLSPTAAGANGANGGVSGNSVTLDFGAVAAGVTECGYFEVDIK